MYKILTIYLLFICCNNLTNKEKINTRINPNDSVASEIFVNRKTQKNNWEVFGFKNDTIFQRIKIWKESEEQINFVFESHNATESKNKILKGIAILEGGNEDGEDGYGLFFKSQNVKCAFWIIINFHKNESKYLSFGGDLDCIEVNPESIFERLPRWGKVPKSTF